MLPEASYAAKDSGVMDQKNGSASSHHSDAGKAAVPVGHRTALGIDQIKQKEEAAKGSSKRGTAKLQGYISGFMGGINSFSHSISNTKGETLTAKQKEKRLSFKERLKLEMERKRQREARTK